MVLKRSIPYQEEDKVVKYSELHPLNAPYHLQNAIDFLSKHQTDVLSHLFDLPPRLQLKAENCVRKSAGFFTRTRQSYVFDYTSECACGSLAPLNASWIEALKETATGTRAQLEAALDLQDDSSLLQMFMGRNPFVEEIRALLREALEIVDDMLLQGCQSHSKQWLWGRKKIHIRNIEATNTEGIAATTIERTIYLKPLFWDQHQLKETDGLVIENHGGDANLHERITEAIASTRASILLHELIHLVSWFKMRRIVRKHKTFDLKHLLPHDCVHDIHHKAYGVREDERDDIIMRVYQPEHSTEGQERAAYDFEAAIKLAQMKQGNIAALLNAQNYTFMSSAAVVEKWLPVLQERSEDSALPFRFAGHLDAMRTISKEVPELFGYQYMLHRPFYLSCPELDAKESKDVSDKFDKVLHSSRFQMAAENGA